VSGSSFRFDFEDKDFMMNEDARIDQFKRMTEADPENELGHFSLGKIHLEAGRYDEAVMCLGRALGLNAKMSKAYQLLGEAFDKSGERGKAVEVLTKGVAVADEQGDRMPRDAMVSLLQSWGASIPPLKDSAPRAAQPGNEAAASSDFRCARCGKQAGRLPKAPFKGPLGEKVLAHTCAACWREWIPMGTKVINELGLALSTQAGQQAYDQYMVEFLQLEDVPHDAS
jgi:tetratricopeptide (TPR) repeat protein